MKIALILITLFAIHARAEGIPDELPMVDGVVQLPADTNQMINDACFADIQIKMAQAELERQKEIQKETGTKDLNRVHGAGSIIVDQRKVLSRALSDYKAETGTKFNLKDCPE